MNGTNRMTPATTPHSTGLGMPISQSAAAMNTPKAAFIPTCARK